VLTTHRAGEAHWLRVLLTRHVLVLGLQYFCFSYVWYFYITWLPTYLREGRGQSGARAAALAVLPLLFGGIGSLTTGMAPKRLPRRLIAFGGFLATAVLLVIVTRIHSVVPAMLAMGLASFASDLTMPISWDACVEIGGPYCATVAASMNMMGNLGGFVAPVIGGIILAHTRGNWNLVIEVMAVLAVISALCWLYLDPEAARRQREVSQAQALSADQLTP
jgi:ACS family glucarate transporter-like MFS transporter